MLSDSRDKTEDASLSHAERISEQPLVVHLVWSVDISYGGEGLAALRLSQHTNSILLVMNEGGCSKQWFVPCEFQKRVKYMATTQTVFRELRDLRKRGVKLFHVHGVWRLQYFILLVFARLLGFRCLISSHGCFGKWAFNSKRFKKTIALALYQRVAISIADKLVASSIREEEDLRNFFPSKAISIIPNGVDLPEEDYLYNQNEHRDKKKTCKKFVFLSRIAPVKGLDLLFTAWQKAFNSEESVQLIIAGNGDPSYLAEMKALVTDLKIEGQVTFIGEVSGSAKEILYSDADIFVLPSRGENFGIAIAEAMARAIPVITTVETPWSCLTTEGMGWCVECSVEAIADALFSANSACTDQLSAMASKSSSFIRNNYSWPEVGRLAHLVYLETIKS